MPGSLGETNPTVRPAESGTSHSYGRRTRSKTGGSRFWMFLVSLIVVAIALIGGLYYLANSPTQSVPLIGKVAAVHFGFNGPSNCWTALTGPGFGWAAGGAIVVISQSLSYNGGSGEPSSCSVLGASITSPGFVLVQTNAPFVVPQGTVALLNVTVQTPPSLYSGMLNLTVNVTSP